MSGGGPWFLAAPGCLEQVGAGDLSYEDLKAVEAGLGDAVFVAQARLATFQEHLTDGGLAKWRGSQKGSFRPARRRQRFEQLRDSKPMTARAVAKDAQVAVIGSLGPVWVDGHRLFKPGETVPLPWTHPRVELVVVRPSTVRAAIEEIIGRKP